MIRRTVGHKTGGMVCVFDPVATAKQKITELERRQLRSMRELVRDPTNAAARLRLDEIDAQIVDLRVTLSGGEVLADTTPDS